MAPEVPLSPLGQVIWAGTMVLSSISNYRRTEMKKREKKLKLARETVRRLAALAKAQGGGGPLSDTLCPSACITCENELPQPTNPAYCS
jgi:hypothetical protein